MESETFSIQMESDMAMKVNVRLLIDSFLALEPKTYNIRSCITRTIIIVTIRERLETNCLNRNKNHFCDNPN